MGSKTHFVSSAAIILTIMLTCVFGAFWNAKAATGLTVSSWVSASFIEGMTFWTGNEFWSYYIQESGSTQDDPEYLYVITDDAGYIYYYDIFHSPSLVFNTSALTETSESGIVYLNGTLSVAYTGTISTGTYRVVGKEADLTETDNVMVSWLPSKNGNKITYNYYITFTDYPYWAGAKLYLGTAYLYLCSSIVTYQNISTTHSITENTVTMLTVPSLNYDYTYYYNALKDAIAELFTTDVDDLIADGEGEVEYHSVIAEINSIYTLTDLLYYYITENNTSENISYIKSDLDSIYNLMKTTYQENWNYTNAELVSLNSQATYIYDKITETYDFLSGTLMDTIDSIDETTKSINTNTLTIISQLEELLKASDEMQDTLDAIKEGTDTISNQINEITAPTIDDAVIQEATTGTSQLATIFAQGAFPLLLGLGLTFGIAGYALYGKGH